MTSRYRIQFLSYVKEIKAKIAQERKDYDDLSKEMKTTI